jgi:Rrf2 family transcriptional regulator, nitric oxide-sensitive transcriptional repressor
MRLTVHTDYALRTLVYLGLHGERLGSIRAIAQAYDISENHLTKVVHRLGRGGFIATVRGRGGGIRLARPPAAIRIGDVVRRTEEDMALVECLGPANACRITPNCRLRGAVDEALRAFLAVLDGYTLADLLDAPEALAGRLGLAVPTAALAPSLPPAA